MLERTRVQSAALIFDNRIEEGLKTDAYTRSWGGLSRPRTGGPFPRPLIEEQSRLRALRQTE